MVLADNTCVPSSKNCGSHLHHRMRRGGQVVAESDVPEKCDSSTELCFVKTPHSKYAALPPACTKGPRGNFLRLLSLR